MADSVPYIHAWDGGANQGGFNQLVGNSTTIGDSTQAGMYRLLTVMVLLNLVGLIQALKTLIFQLAITTIPFQLAINDNDDTRDAQLAWSSKSTSAWWNTPSQWEVVALVGADAASSV